MITCATDLKITISGTPAKDGRFIIRMPDIQTEERFEIDGSRLAYVKKRDYLRSVYNVLLKHGVAPRNGAACTIRGTIPINAGTSSSSALCVAWTRFLLRLNGSEKADDAHFVARMAWLAEVTEFNEPGGMMDPYASALGGVQLLRFHPRVKSVALRLPPGRFILIDSGEPKDTLGLLARVRQGVREAVRQMKGFYPDFDLFTTPLEKVRAFWDRLPDNGTALLQGALMNRDITQQAVRLIQEHPSPEQAFGALLNRHHSVLSGKTGVSTEKIDRLWRAAREAGALGGKINGSGGGGCLFVYTTGAPEPIMEAVQKEGAARVYPLRTD
ncbi:MAG: GHMP kinase [Calditrichaeota bacterium]|nr:MAG: GHMP kinase [Calditrichota bacterium]